MSLINIFISWRLWLLFLASISHRLLPFKNSFPYTESLLTNSNLPSFLWAFANFDGVHYLTIARAGYAAQYTQVFFPLYPILIHYVGLLTGGNLIISGLIISNIAFLISIFVLKKLLEIDYSHDLVRWTIIFLILFPTSFYFGSLYTESLFFLLVLLSFYFARKGNWILAGITGLLASLTRFFGILLLPALLIEWYLQKKSITRIIPLLLIPLGLLIYMYYLQVNFNDPLYFIHAQAFFGAQRTGGSIILFPQVVFRYLKIIFTPSLPLVALYPALLEFVVSIIFLVLSVIALFRVRLSYSFFSFFSFIIPTLTGTFSSMPRYVIILFPCLIILSKIRSKSLKYIICLVFLLTLTILTILFTRGYWIA